MTKKYLKEKFANIIDDWWEPSGEEFKYDIMVKEPYTFSPWNWNQQCQHTETFETLAQLHYALKHINKVTVEEHCKKCRFFNGTKCIK